MKILMCRPDFYGIEYEINPWMNIEHKVNQSLAKTQWEALYRTLQTSGAEIKLVPPVKGLPDLVFTANAGLFYKNKIILPHFKFKERQGELPYYTKWFEENGFTIANTITDETPYYEGAGDSLLAGNKLFAGYGFRSDRKFYEEADFFDHSQIILCELADPYFYHIDTCFCPLNEKIAMWYPPAFTKETQKKIENEIELIAVEEPEAKQFACNAVVLNQKVILPAGCEKIKSDLEKIDFEAIPCDVSEYIKAGGACKCLTLRLD